jgi:uncharacterized protein (TIGR02996 family)
MLNEALVALRAERLEDGLRLLLDAWRANRAPRVAALIDIVTEHLPARPALAGKTFADVQTAFVAVAGANDPADIPRLLTALPRGRVGQATARLRLLPTDDPRVSAGIIHLLDDPPFHKPSTRPFWERVLAVVVTIGDPRARAALTTARERVPARFAKLMATWLVEALGGAAARIGEAPSLDAADAAIADEIEALFHGDQRRARASQKTAEDFLAQIYEQPDDDAIRKVFADWLQDRGDPRGELIALQYARLEAPPTPAALRRERALLKEHGAPWQGALAPVLQKEGWVFERGFLDACWYDPKVAARAETVLGVREWATVRDVEFRNFAGGKTARAAELIRHPIMRSLRRVSGLWGVTARALALAKPPLALQHMGFMAAKLTGDDSDVLGEARGLPQLTSLSLEEARTFDPVRFRWVFQSPLGERLIALAADAGLPALVPWLAELHQHAGKKLGRFELVARGWRVTLTRDPRGWFSLARAVLEPQRWKIDDPLRQLCTYAIDHLPPTALTQLEVIVPERMQLVHEDSLRLRRSVERLTLEKVSLPP